MDIENISKQLDSIETSMTAFQEKATEEIKAAGKVSNETKAAMDKLGEQQREMADRLLQIEQKGTGGTAPTAEKSLGDQVVNSDQYSAFTGGSATKMRLEIQNSTTTGSDATVAPDRKPGVVPGAFQPMTLESLFPSVPTSSNAIEFTKEASFTNNAAETAEGGAKPETNITFSLVNMPISTVAHWTKISKQLAADAPALAAYINTRMVYGVDRRVETQLGVGDGVAPNISGILDAGNFTAHGYAAAALGGTLAKHVLIRKMIADAWAAGYPVDAILLNPADWATIEIEALTTAAGQVRVSYTQAGQPMLFGIPVVQSVGMTADNVAVGAFRMAGTIHNRQAVTVDMSESDSDNFTKNLITIRAERRLALAIEVPAAIIAGDLTPL